MSTVKKDRFSPSFRLLRVVQRAALLAALWWILTGGSLASWTVGAPAVAAAVCLSVWLPAAMPWRWSLVGLLQFVPFFVWHTVIGSVDVARRAVQPAMPLVPRLHEHRLQLPPGPARVFMINTLSLLPGTLSTEISRDTLTVHVLDATQPVAFHVSQLEQVVADLFGIELPRQRDKEFGDG